MKSMAMDGDDIIKINFDAGNALADLTSANPIKIDGGHDNLAQGAPNGRGDTLVLEGASVNLDFTAVDGGYIKGIERLDLNAAGTDATVTLGLQDVIQMTDFENTLIIRASGGDTLNFVAGDFAGFTKTDNQSIDDDAGSAIPTNFDVYSDGKCDASCRRHRRSRKRPPRLIKSKPY